MNGKSSRRMAMAVAGICVLSQLGASVCFAQGVKTWGRNDVGQLGDGTTTTRLTPVSVVGLPNVFSISAGGAAPFGTAVGSSFAGLAEGGALKAWGDNYYGILGNGAFGTGQYSKDAIDVLNLDGIVQISSCASHTLALRNDGTVWACGDNTYGALGDGTTVPKTVPGPYPGLFNVVAVGADTYGSFALLRDGTVKVWGYGTGTNRPTTVPNLTNVKEIQAGAYCRYVRLADGTVKAWGYNDYGQLGDGTTTRRTWLTPVSVSGLNNVVALAAGNYFALALLNNGTIRGWGKNDLGQLGDGTTTQRLTPSPAGQGLTTVVAISAGNDHALALLADGTVRAWGGNDSGQLGDGTQANRTSPVSVSGLSNVGAISAGAFHSMALIGGAGRNLYPMTFAGADATIYLPSMAALSGSITDDGKPNPPGVVAGAWSKVSGPGTVTFVNPNALATSASFSLPGVYVLRLTGGDGVLSSSDTVTITANGLTSGIPGDINGDGVVNVDDLNILIRNFGRDH